jgi:hypothetical protein
MSGDNFDSVSPRTVAMRLDHLQQWYPNSGRDPNQGCWGSDVGSREGFMDNSVNMEKIKISV